MVMSLQISLAALAIGYLIDLAIGDPHRMPHPIRLIGMLISGLEKLLRKPKSQRGEFAGGIFLVVFVVLISAGIPLGLLALAQWVSPWLRLGVESIFCWQMLATRSLRTESMKVHRSLQAGDVEGARKNVSMIVGRDTENLDEAGITRAAVETVAENASDGVIAPLLYMFLGGAVLGFAYKAVNTMDSMVGYTDERYLFFGRAAARTDDVVNFLPARISALFLLLACPLTGLDRKNGARIWKRDRRKHASPNSGQTEAVAAGALRVRLAGDAVYHGELHRKEFIGDDDRPIEAADIRRVNNLMTVASLLVLLFFGLVKTLAILLFYLL